MSSKKNVNNILSMWYNTIKDLTSDSWWEATSCWERSIGAVLCQNTTWKNAQKAITNLRSSTLFSNPETIFEYTEKELQDYIRPAGFFIQKSQTLITLFSLFSTYTFSEQMLQEENTQTLRNKLLSCKGIGQETADLLLLFCFDHPIFPVGAYTARILQRHGLIEEFCTYQDLQDFFMDVLEEDMILYKRYYSSLIYIGQKWCRRNKAICIECVLYPFEEREYF
ncbi:MAG: endonuclease III domain-containing protein [Desulfovibrionaceae bacterium]